MGFIIQICGRESRRKYRRFEVHQWSQRPSQASLSTARQAEVCPPRLAKSGGILFVICEQCGCDSSIVTRRLRHALLMMSDTMRQGDRPVVLVKITRVSLL
ncbi:hypothetical protein E2C01_100488 [Portunus trituberculatus]|uniref:Uncharacterized protein n=1 Tax=Portunus trituberculatus TaxID=210409 RepID=A0A5B7K722_PORTR|nr:hypothetical protein [Portunus trituberculatus]